jgi:hypothetical protein
MLGSMFQEEHLEVVGWLKMHPVLQVCNYKLTREPDIFLENVPAAAPHRLLSLPLCPSTQVSFQNFMVVMST